MEIALYHPKAGYYSGGVPRDREGDYFTSPAAHPAFGALIAVLLSRMWEALDRPTAFFAVEAGAGDGTLARDVVSYAQAALGRFGDALSYVGLDRSVPPSADGRASSGHSRIVTASLPLKGVVGCLLSNELIDAFPTHRFEIHDGRVLEVFVALDEGNFVELVDEPSTPMLSERLAGLADPLPDRFRGEICLQTGPWIDQVADALDTGFVLTIDYGHEADHLYSPERATGTVQTFFRHTSGSSPYQRIGRQDITAHVDFSVLKDQGAASGLRSLGLIAQAELLTALGFGDWLDRLQRRQMRQRSRDANIMAMRELIKPEGLGGFKVLIQGKNTGTTQHQLLEKQGAEGEQSIPLLDGDSVPLMEGRYPHAAWDPGELWPQGLSQDARSSRPS